MASLEEERQSMSRITVSRDALRADLAEMELRLRVYFDEQLKHKADAAPLAELQLKVDSLDRGDFSDVHARALAAFMDSRMVEKTDAGWTARQRVFGSIAVAVAILSLLFTVYVWAAPQAETQQQERSLRSQLSIERGLDARK